MWELTFYSLVENTCMTSSFTKREFCTHKVNYIYMYARSMDVACFCDNSIWFLNCSNNVVFFFSFHNIYLFCHYFMFFATSWWYVYISRFYLSLPVCLDPSFCSYSSGCIYAIFVLLVVFDPSMLVLTLNLYKL
jgi:hypothetical protein